MPKLASDSQPDPPPFPAIYEAEMTVWGPDVSRPLLKITVHAPARMVEGVMNRVADLLIEEAEK